MRRTCDVPGCSEPGIHRLSIILRKAGSDTGAIWRRQVAWVCAKHAETVDVVVSLHESEARGDTPSEGG